MAGSSKSKGKGKGGDQSGSVYGLTHRREMCGTGDTYLCVNSHELGDYIPKNQLPEHIVDVKYTPKGIKVTREVANAEKTLVSNSRRHQMRLSAHMDTGTKPKRDQNGKYPTGQSIIVGNGSY